MPSTPQSAIGGATLLLLSVSGLLGKVARIFTPRVIVVILGLIAMTLAPVIISLLFGEGHDLFSFAFFLVGLIATFALERFLRGVGKSLTVMIVTVAGSFVYFLFNGMPEVQSAGYTTDIDKLIIKPEVDIPVVISFLVCFFALLINELGSIESVRSLIGAADNGKMRRGCAVTGAGNILAGMMGVIGLWIILFLPESSHPHAAPRSPQSSPAPSDCSHAPVCPTPWCGSPSFRMS